MFFYLTCKCLLLQYIGTHYKSILLFAELQMRSNINTNKWRLKFFQTPFRPQLDNLIKQLSVNYSNKVG